MARWLICNDSLSRPTHHSSAASKPALQTRNTNHEYQATTVASKPRLGGFPDEDVCVIEDPCCRRSARRG